MKMPSVNDTHVKVRAYLTDEAFGYEHWRAAQFAAPTVASARHAILIICDSEADRDQRLAALSASVPARVMP